MEDFDWSIDCQHALESVKAALDFSRPFLLEVYASAVDVGSVLVQADPSGIEDPVSYFSRKFNKHQSHYSTIEKETLALLWSFQHFKVYIESCRFPLVVRTHYNPLVFLQRMNNHNQRLMRWALLVQKGRRQCCSFVQSIVVFCIIVSNLRV